VRLVKILELVKTLVERWPVTALDRVSEDHRTWARVSGVSSWDGWLVGRGVVAPAVAVAPVSVAPVAVVELGYTYRPA